MGKARQALRYVWHLLGSTRLAAILLAALLLAALLASLFPQMPADPAARETWLAAVRLRYRGATDLLRAVGLLDAYHNPWFLALLAAVGLNLLICTLQRLPRRWRSFIQRPQIARSDAFYEGFDLPIEWSITSREAGLSAAQQALARHRYRIYHEGDEAARRSSLYAERGRWAQAGTVVSHLAALLLLFAVLARPVLSWQETGVVLLPGGIHTLGRHPGVAVRAGLLTIGRYPDGQIRNYQVPLAILVDGSPAVTRTAAINHPLTVQAMTFHLQSYGPSLALTAPEGTFDLAFTDDQAQEVQLPEAGLTLRVAYRPEGPSLFVEALTTGGTLLGSGTVADGEQIVVDGTPLTFRLGSYTTWQISHDPTFGLALAAAACLLAGMLASLWVLHRRLWLRVEDQRMCMVADGVPEVDLDLLAIEVGRAAGQAVATPGSVADQPEEKADGG
jgi:cytochrome c biogenesis protein